MFCLPLSNFTLRRFDTDKHKYVGDSFYFIATGFTPVPEAVCSCQLSFEVLRRSKSGGDIHSKGLKEGICFRIEEGQCTSQCRHCNSSRPEGILRRDWKTSREPDSSRNECKCRCHDESDGRYITLCPTAENFPLMILQVC